MVSEASDVPASDRSRAKCWRHVSRGSPTRLIRSPVTKAIWPLFRSPSRRRDQEALAHERAKVNITRLNEPKAIQVFGQAGDEISTSRNVSSSRRMKAAAANTGGVDNRQRSGRLQNTAPFRLVCPASQNSPDDDRDRIQHPGREEDRNAPNPLNEVRSGNWTRSELERLSRPQ